MMLTDEDAKWLSETMSGMTLKLAAMKDRHVGQLPAVSRDGIYDDRLDESIEWPEDDGLVWWTNGFWGGLFNQMYSYDGNPEWLKPGLSVEKALDATYIKHYMGLHHDVGFMWLPTSVARYMLTSDNVSIRRGLLAAQLLAGRFNPNGNFIRAWNDLSDKSPSNRGWAIIDCMLNISILFWASDILGDSRYEVIAMRHADTTLKNFIRPDGSVRHICEFDADTGEFIREIGGQGMAVGSSWSRGQGWALYGFANAYRHTSRKEYLEASIKVADRIISRLPENMHVPVDFDQPEDLEFEDSTAAAIIASGLLELDKLAPGRKYGKTAIRLLKFLTDERSDWNPDTDGILQKCTASYNGINDREVNFVYADYYFLEALLKLQGKEVMFW